MKRILLFASIILASFVARSQCTPVVLFESFESTTPTQGGTWEKISVVANSTASNARTGVRCLAIGTVGGYIRTPQLENVDSFSFWYKRSGTSAPTRKIVVEYSYNNINWFQIGDTIQDFTTTYKKCSRSISSLGLTGPYYIRVVDTRTATGGAQWFLDDMSWTSTVPNNNNKIVSSLGSSVSSCTYTIKDGVTYQFTDHSGINDIYNAAQDHTLTFVPELSTKRVKVSFTQFRTEDSFDGMVIHNGLNTAAPIINSGLPEAVNGDPVNCPAGSYYGTVSPGTKEATSTSGALTFQFRSDFNTIRDSGWIATVELIDACANSWVIETTACDSFTFLGNTYTSTGIYNDTLTNAAGCDSVITLDLIIENSPWQNTNIVACNSTVLDGVTIFSDTSITKAFDIPGNCDSFHTYNITINNSNTGSSNVVACNSTVIEGITITNDTTFTYNYTNASDCDSVHTYIVTINNSNTGSSDVVACNSTVIEGITITNDTTFTYPYTNDAGCDSVHTYIVTINNSSTGSSDVVACNSTVIEGITITNDTTFTYPYTNDAGCDSVHTYIVTINNSNTGSSNVVACNSTVIEGITITNDTTFTYNYTNASDCDSVHTYIVTINNSNTGSSNVVACNSTVIEGITITNDTTFTYPYTNDAGCDSVHTYIVTINNSNTGSSNVVACNSTVIEGITITNDTTFTYPYTNDAGCDSVHTYIVTINNSSVSSETITACETFTWTANGTTYNTSGTYMHTLENDAGCDSVLTLNLTISGDGSVTPSDNADTQTVNNNTAYYYDASCNIIASVQSTENLGVVTSSAIVGSTVSTYNGQPYVSRTFDISTANAGGGIVTLYFLPSEFTLFNDNNGTYPDINSSGSNLMITAFHSSPDIGGSGPDGYSTDSVTLITPTSVSFNIVKGRWEVTFYTATFSGFYAHTINAPVPLAITIDEIKAENNGNYNIVTWNTLKENADDNFELESSADGHSFSQIARIPARGYASHYSFTDNKPYEGMNYYRLKSIDTDGHIHYSKIVSALVSQNFSIEAYPNPVKDNITLTINGKVSSKAQIQVTDFNGKVLSIINPMEKNLVHIPFHQYAQGVYIIMYEDEGVQSSIKVNKK